MSACLSGLCRVHVDDFVILLMNMYWRYAIMLYCRDRRFSWMHNNYSISFQREALSNPLQRP